RSSTSSSDDNACFSVTFETLLFRPHSADAPSASAYPIRGSGRVAAATGKGASVTRCGGGEEAARRRRAGSSRGSRRGRKRERERAGRVLPPPEHAKAA